MHVVVDSQTAALFTGHGPPCGKYFNNSKPTFDEHVYLWQVAALRI